MHLNGELLWSAMTLTPLSSSKVVETLIWYSHESQLARRVLSSMSACLTSKKDSTLQLEWGLLAAAEGRAVRTRR